MIGVDDYLVYRRSGRRSRSRGDNERSGGLPNLQEELEHEEEDENME